MTDDDTKKTLHEDEIDGDEIADDETAEDPDDDDGPHPPEEKS